LSETVITKNGVGTYIIITYSFDDIV